MKKKLFLSAFLLVAVYLGAFAQYATLKIADKEFEKFNYSIAVEHYQEAYDKRPTVRAVTGLAESYYHMRDFKQAEPWYRILANQDEPEVADILHYGHTLRSNAKFREAKAQYQRVARYEARTITLDELESLYRACDSAEVWMQQPDPGHVVENAGFMNSIFSDFGAVEHQERVLFSSDRMDRQDDAKVYGWTGHAYLGLYQAQDGRVEQAPLTWYDAEHHVGPVSISEERNEVYFAVTRRLTSRERRKAPKMATVNIEIFSNALDAHDWGEDAEPFQYNNIIEWSVGDPFVSHSGDTLYFVSDMPGGFGGTDIYYCVRGEDGTWSEAVNMGPTINTHRDERFPSVDPYGNFYFSSDGHAGMGGLDIFMKPTGNNQAIRNLGYPLNSPGDDFSPRFSKDFQGYFSSNRLGGRGGDDVYSFNLNREVKIILEGKIVNAKSDLAISDAELTLMSHGAEEQEVRLHSQQNGTFRFNLEPGLRYELGARQTGFKAFSPLLVDTRGMDTSQTIYRELRLDPVEKEEVVVLRNIYFDFDKSDIRPDAAIELSKIVSFLNSDPSVHIELSAHTDSRGSTEYNTALSQRRAESAVAFLVAAGIDANRLTARGFGFSRLANHCAPGVECTEEEHQYNRRVEFFILK